MLQLLQAQFDENAVLVHQGDQIRDRPQSHQVQELAEIAAVMLPQCLYQFVGDAHTGEIWERIAAVPPLGIDHRHCLWQLCLHLVVIGDDQIQADRPGELRLGGCRDSTVHRDHQRTGLADFDQRILMQPVAIVHAVGDEIANQRRIPGEAAQNLHQKHHRCLAVNVVITVNGDGFSIGQCFHDSFHCRLHVRKQQR